MKKKILLIAAIAVFSLLLVACAGGFDSIMFEKPPRTTYVQGQDIDFTDTVLVAMKGEEKENVDLTADNVTITGYDKNQLGKQTVTFTYGEVSTTLNVTVIPRIAVEGVVTDYFVGDEVNRTEGRIRVADDSGKTSTVNFNSDSITTEGFDSSTAGEKTVTVKYGEYTGTYTANVYNVENVELSKRPQKTFYDSHDTEFSLTGSYFTVTANGGALSRFVSLTSENIKDFDPSRATVDNISERLPMTVKIHYLGYEFDYEIYVIYSAVSYMNDIAKKLVDVTDPKTCDAETAENAIDALGGYFSLSSGDKKLIDKKDAEKVALVVAYHGLEKFNKLIDKYSDSFVLVREEVAEGEESEFGKYYGLFSIKAESYAASLSALNDLQGEEGEKINDLAATLRSIEEEFPELTIDEQEMDEYLGYVFTGDLDVLIGIFSVMVEVYDELSESVIPKDWTAEGLLEYKTNIKKAVVAITDSEYNPYIYEPYLEMFKMLSTWRENDDIFHIISSYYLTHEPDSYVDTIWEKVPLPGDLNNLYLIIRYGIIVTNNMRIGSDTTPFIYYYKKALELSEEIKNGDDEIEKEVYNSIGFDYLIRSYFYTGENIDNIAYVYHASGLVGNEKIEALVEKYIELVTRVYTEVDFDFKAKDVVNKSKELFSDFMALSPAERYGFIGMIHCDYRGNILDDSVLAYILEDGVMSTYNLFARFILNAYKATLSEESFDMFARLFVATENASLYKFKIDGKEEFISEMEAIVADLESLSASERAFFLNEFDEIFTIYNEINSAKNPDISSYQEKVDKLVEYINRFFALQGDIGENTDFVTNGKSISLLLANYEKAKALADELLSLNDENLTYHYYYTNYTFGVEGDEENRIAYSLDFIMQEMATVRTHILLFTDVTVQYKEIEEGEDEEDYTTDVNAFYIYDISEISSFLADAYEILWAQHKGTVSELDPELVLSVMKKKLDLSDNGIFAFKTFKVSEIYYDAVSAVFAETLTPEIYGLLEKLIKADDAYAAYVAEDINEKLEAFENAVNELKSAYEECSDKTEFESFKEIYDYVIEKYEEATAPDDDTSEEEKTPEE